MKNLGNILKGILAIFLLAMLFHPILTIIVLVKLGGLFFAVVVVAVLLKVTLGVSIIGLLKGKDEK